MVCLSAAESDTQRVLKMLKCKLNAQLIKELATPPLFELQNLNWNRGSKNELRERAPRQTHLCISLQYLILPPPPTQSHSPLRAPHPWPVWVLPTPACMPPAGPPPLQTPQLWGFSPDVLDGVLMYSHFRCPEAIDLADIFVSVAVPVVAGHKSDILCEVNMGSAFRIGKVSAHSSWLATKICHF